MKFLFACGGTAGHINPAIAIAGRLKNILPDAEFLFIGAKGNMETELVPREGYPIRTIQVTSLHRSIKPGDIVHNLKSLRNVVRSAKEAKKIIQAFRPDVAIGTGGYVCYPVIRAASKLGVPTLIHEANAKPGLTTRMLEGCCDTICVAFEESRSAYKKPDKIVVTGMPVRGAFREYNYLQARAELGIGPAERLVVSFWGSLGASHMNEIMADFIAANLESRAFRHIHAAGVGQYGAGRLREMLAQRGLNLEKSPVELRDYIYDMPKVMRAADLVLCRAGASTLGELTAVGKPAVIIPSPYVTGDHQTKNAMVLAHAGAAEVLSEKEADGERLYSTVSGLLADPERLEEMARKMEKLGARDATEMLVGLILEKVFEQNED